MSKKTKATYTQGRGSKAKGAYNPNHNTLEATRKGQSHIDEERMHLNRYIRFDRNGRGHTSAGGNGGFNATQHERERYEELYGKGLESRNQRYLASRHKERCRTMGEIYQDLKTAPLESIWQVGNSHSDMPKEEMRDALIKAWNMTIVEFRKNYGQNMIPLDAALHMDEKVCHIHFRVTLGAVDEYGHFMPNQTAALTAMGFERPDPSKPRSRYNNALIAFTDTIRERFYQNCERCGLEIDREVQNYSKRQVEILEYKCDQFRKEMEESKRQAEVQQEAAKQAQIVLGQTQQSINELNAKITQLTAENTGLRVENEALKNQLADLRQQITDTKKLQDKAEQDRADAVKKLEDIENYQKGLFRQWQSRKVREYGTLPAEKEKKNWRGQVTQEAKPARTIVATEDLERMKTQAQYNVMVDYNHDTVSKIEKTISTDDVIKALKAQVEQQQTRINELEQQSGKQQLTISNHEYFLKQKGLTAEFEAPAHAQEHTHHHHP